MISKNYVDGLEIHIADLQQRNAELEAHVEKLTTWRDLALQFDAARMSANLLLKCLLSCHDNDVFTAEAWDKTFEEVRKLLKDSPLSILAEHDREVAARAGKAGFIAGFKYRSELAALRKMWADSEVRGLACEYANQLRASTKAG